MSAAGKQKGIDSGLVLSSDSDQDLKLMNMKPVQLRRPNRALSKIPGFNKSLLLSLNLQNIVNYNSRYVSSTF